MRNLRTICLFCFAFGMLAIPAASHAQIAVGVSIRIAPPVLPVYEQPACPAPGYMWTPGYWAYGPDGYYWVPGTWVMAPEVGLLWTPGYWGWGGGLYAWHAGYWGPHVGFYGGVNYGFGYVGVGFVGGYWNHGVFAYNRAVTNVNVTVIHNTYEKTVVANNNTHVSYNGGTGGLSARPTAEEQAAASEHHVAPTSAQVDHEHTASTNRALLASENHGRPPVAATERPGEFNGHGVVAARAAGPAHSADRPPSARNGADRPMDRPVSGGGNTASSEAKGGHSVTPAEKPAHTPPAANGHAQSKPPKSNNGKPPKKDGKKDGRG